MSSSSKDPPNDVGGDDPFFSPGSQLALLMTNEDVDDALNFDLDFDQIAETMGDALPDIDLEGSLGTRSPSPSAASSGVSILSKGSKRSRSEFDSESDCNSERQEKSSKRMDFQTGLPMSRTGSGPDVDQFLQNYHQQQKESSNNPSRRGADPSPSKVIRRDREREGRCPDCGLETHRIAMDENGFDIIPLTIEGEVLDGRCLLCNPLKEGESIPKKGGRNNNSGERSSSKTRGGQEKGFDIKEPPGSEAPDVSSRGRSSPRPPSRSKSNTAMNLTNMSPPLHQQQRQQMMMQHNEKHSPSPSGNHLALPPVGRDGRDHYSRRDSSGNNANKLSTPAPNHYHSKMALAMQSKLPRKHAPIQHAMLAFGQTNNRKGGKNKNPRSNRDYSRRISGGSGIGNRQMMGGGGAWQSKNRQRSSSKESLSSVSCSEYEGVSHLVSNSNADDKSNFSKGRHFSYSDLGGLGKAMAMGIGMSCSEPDQQYNMQQQQQHKIQGARSPDPPSQPQTPQQSRRNPSDPPMTRSGSDIFQTPPSVPANMSNIMSNRVMPPPQSAPPNMNNVMSNRMGGGRGSNQNLQQRSASKSDMLNDVTGNIPPAVRLAHSKLSSSIYHHHVYPMPEDTERAHAEKTLSYLDTGSGDIADIIVAMRRFPFSLSIQRVSCEKLYAHCFDTEHAHAIGLVGGIRTIIDAMEHHPNDISLQRGCAGLIKHLATASTYNVEMLDKMDAVGIIVETMKRHLNCAPLLESCCWAMESMSRINNQEIKMRVVKGGGIHAAMKAVEVFPNNESLLRAAFHCLRQLGYNPSTYNNQGGQGGQNHFQLEKQHMLKLQQYQKKQQQQQRQNRSKSKQKQRQQQVPSFISHRGSSGSSGRNNDGGGGMNMMPNNMFNNVTMGTNSPMMMGNNMGNNNAGMNNPMMGNMMSNNPMMGGNGGMNNMRGNTMNMSNMGGNSGMGNSSSMNNNMNSMNNMSNNRYM